MTILIILLSYIILGVMMFIILNEFVRAASKLTEESSYDVFDMIKTAIKEKNSTKKYPTARYICVICSVVMIWPVFLSIILLMSILIFVDYFCNGDE